mgnify:CR=1 FL=1
MPMNKFLRTAHYVFVFIFLILAFISGSEPLHGSAWFGSVWGGFLGGILGGIARAGFSHRESALPDPLNY